MNTNSIQRLNSLLPADLREETANPSTPWGISEELFARLRDSELVSAEKTTIYRKVLVLPTDPEWRFVWKYFSHDLPNRYMIKSIICVHNRHQTRAFEVQLISQEKEVDKFPANWQQESKSELRLKAIVRWKGGVELFSPVSTKEEDGRIYHWNSVKVLPLWHGTKKEICASICDSGFTFFGKKSLTSKKEGDPKSTDLGFFGSGIYFTNSARYAADIYSEGHLLLSWVSMREPFPVVDGDIATLVGSTAYKHYNAHYAPVRSIDGSNLYEPCYYPCKSNEEPHCDELVVFQSAQTLPRFWIELEIVDLYRKKISATPRFVEDFIPHFFKIMQNREVELDKKVRQVLSDFLANLLRADPLDDLNSDHLQFYQLMSQLVNNSGQIDQIIRTKLIDTTKAIPSPSPKIQKVTSPVNNNLSASLKEEPEAEYKLGVKFRDGVETTKNAEEAARHFKIAADQGHVLAQLELGLMYQYGRGVKKNEVEAIRLIALAANQGNATAQYTLAVMYQYGTCVKKDEVEAVRLYTLAAKRGNAMAQYNLGAMYAKGIGVKKDEKEAARLFALAAGQKSESNENAAHVPLKNNSNGLREEYVSVIPKIVQNPEADAETRTTSEYVTLNIPGNAIIPNKVRLNDTPLLFKSVTNSENISLATPQEEYCLGLKLRDGTGVPKNEKEAVYHFMCAAEQGYVLAQYNLGIMYANGTGVKKNEEEAARLYTLAANQGHVAAQYNLGVLYENGVGVSKNEEEAIRLYTLAAKRGNAEAQNKINLINKMKANGESGIVSPQVGEKVLSSEVKYMTPVELIEAYLQGIRFRDGMGVTKNDEEAVRHFKIAADRGHILAQFSLGEMYQTGRGVKKNEVEAVRLFTLAANKGNPSAQYALGLLYQSGTCLQENEAEAARLYTLASKQGNAEAQYNLGLMYVKGIGIKNDEKEAARLFTLAANQGMTVASTALQELSKNEPKSKGEEFVSLVPKIVQNPQADDERRAVKNYSSMEEMSNAINPKKLELKSEYIPLDKVLEKAREEYCLAVKFRDGTGVPKNEQQAVVHFMRATEQGYVLAQYHLGVMYANGTGVKKNEEEARRLYTLAANQNNADARYSLGLMYAIGKGGPRNETEAVRYYALAADQGHALAQNNLALMYENGTEVQKNMMEAARLYTLAANQGVAISQYKLGKLYATGTGVQKNENEAVRLYQLAVKQGYANAQYNLGLMYESGTGVNKNEIEAKRLYELAAKQGNENAKNRLQEIYDKLTKVNYTSYAALKRESFQRNESALTSEANSLAEEEYELGLKYRDGVGVLQNGITAVSHFKLASELGYAPAQYTLGLMYASGTGVKKDEAEAARYYQLAANQGYASAQNNLALMYESGTGVKKNEKEAVRLYNLAANQGIAISQYKLGKFYANGIGVPKSEEAAVQLYMLAAEQGFANAQYNLGLMYESGCGVKKDQMEAVRLYTLAAKQGHPQAESKLALLR